MNESEKLLCFCCFPTRELLIGLLLQEKSKFSPDLNVFLLLQLASQNFAKDLLFIMVSHSHPSPLFPREQLPPRPPSSPVFPGKTHPKKRFLFLRLHRSPLPFRRRRQTREDTRSGNISSSSPSVEKYSLPSCINSHSTVSCKIIRTWLEAAASEAGLRLRTTRRPSCWDTSQCRRS